MNTRNYGDEKTTKQSKSKHLFLLIRQSQRRKYQKKIKNTLHVWFVFNAYNIRNLFTKSTTQWLYYKNDNTDDAACHYFTVLCSFIACV